MADETKTRILQFVEYKRISVREFCRRCGFSHAIFTTPSSLGSDKLAKIIDKFPEFNVHWALTGIGEMLTTSNTTQPAADTDKRYFELLEKYSRLQEDYAAQLMQNQRQQAPTRRAGNGE